jgi:hypothetical protein
MQNLDHSISEMYFKGYIDREDGINRSSNPGRMEKLLTPLEQFEVVQPPEELKVEK